ncbi:transcriptional attenuator, LytR family [Thermoactinomyces sp. DSM 45891]|uniref:LCP family protein n=1 Tax=Thermoactinomyces sp. DSM 45891 TaxID=1761907 RepID=UPI0009122F40|nr:LCP family protein [Thermoactinomyces sp. DSM 45891]SFX23263.1 transcriptional attenuator, LytR family [Thermoactinomyces sp. DSM 45891]
MKNQRSEQQVARRKKRNRILLICLAILALTGSFYIYQMWNALAKGHDSNATKSDLRQKQVEIGKDPFTVLLMGVDSRTAKGEKESWRPDVLMIATINPAKKSASIVSIPRDTRTTITHTNGWKDKINSAATWGREKGIDPVSNVRLTVESFLEGVPIDYYAKINFQGFMDVVNQLGGVDVDVKRAFTYRSFNDKIIHFRLGPMHLNGEEALAYVRMRKQDPEGDHGRNRRQQEVINQLLDKLTGVQVLTKFTSLTEIVGNNFSYSFSPSEIPTLASIYRSIPKESLKHITIQAPSERINGIWYDLVSQKERDRVSNLLKKELDLPYDQNKIEVPQMKKTN